MFKYVWIIMLVIAAVIFIGYTIYAIYDSYISASRFVDDYDIEWLLSETLEYFWIDHNKLCSFWFAIFLSTIILTFMFSLAVYGSSKTGG